MKKIMLGAIALSAVAGLAACGSASHATVNTNSSPAASTYHSAPGLGLSGNNRVILGLPVRAAH